MNYRCYGVTISSELPLPLPQEDPGVSPGIAVRVVEGLPRPGDGGQWVGREGGGWRYQVAGVSTWLWSPSCGAFAVHGAQGLIEVDPHGDRRRVVRSLLTTALSCALAEAGKLTLHAGAVAGPAGSVAIGGRSGTGKSTCVASLVAAGWECLHDDLTVLTPDVLTPDWVAHPGPRNVWLRPEAAAALGVEQPEMLDGKVSLPVGPAESSRLRAVVLLDQRGRDDGLRRISPKDAAIRMGLELGAWLLSERARHLRFELLGRLAEEVPCYAWSPPSGIASAGLALDAALRDRDLRLATHP